MLLHWYCRGVYSQGYEYARRFVIVIDRLWSLWTLQGETSAVIVSLPPVALVNVDPARPQYTRNSLRPRAVRITMLLSHTILMPM